MDTASGPIATAKSLLRAMLSGCYAFQNLDGVSRSASVLLDRIYLDALPPPRGQAADYTREQLEDLRPYAIVYMPEERGFETWHTSGGGRQGFTPRGVLRIILFRAVPEDEQDDPGSADRSFENAVGSIIQSGVTNQPGLVELSGTSTYLQLGWIGLDSIERSHPNQYPTEGDFQAATITVRWGVDT